MIKLETRLSRKWIDELRREVSKRNEFILCSKIHGEEYQEVMSDYVICYEGKYIAVEFKTDKNRLTNNQDTFLEAVSRCNGVAITIEFDEHQDHRYFTMHLKLKGIKIWDLYYNEANLTPLAYIKLAIIRSQ